MKEHASEGEYFYVEFRYSSCASVGSVSCSVHLQTKDICIMC